MHLIEVEPSRPKPPRAGLTASPHEPRARHYWEHFRGQEKRLFVVTKRPTENPLAAT